MRQTSCAEGRFLDPPSAFDDGLITSEEDVGGREVSEALVIARVVVGVHEGLDLSFQIARQEVVLQQDPVLHGIT